MPPKPRQAKAKAAEPRPTRAAATKVTTETTTKTATKATTKTAAKPAAKPATKAAAKPTKAAPAAKQTKATKAASAKPAPKAKAAAASKKRKLESEDEASPEPEKAPPAKRTKAAAAAPSKRQRAKSPTPKPEKPLPVINTAPERVLEVFAFGNGENGELGLGPSKTETTVPRRNPFLDPRDPAKYHVVQLDCGGMHTIALTKDNKIVTWGVNDKGALGRDTAWEGGLRDADASDSDSESEDGDLNPKESTPTDIPASAFPEGTKFVQVSAGDSCSFALTDTGLIYGWGTFLVGLCACTFFAILFPRKQKLGLY